MSLTVLRGNVSGLILQPNQGIHQNPDGSGDANLSYKCPWALLAQFLPTPLQSHPIFPTLKLYEFHIEREEGDIGRYDLSFKGVLASDPMALAQYELNLAGTSEPIETNPKFNYPPDNPPVTASDLTKINLALQNNASPSGLSDAATLLYNKKLRGRDSYLRIGATFRVSYVQANLPSNIRGVGQIASQKPENAPDPDDSLGENYLFSGMSWRMAAGVVSVSEEYQLSGPGGWDPDLYGGT